MSEFVIDARGHHCPTPTLKLQKALRAAPDGSEVRLLADDPMARIDVPYFVQQSGHVLVETAVDGAQLSFLVRKGGECPHSTAHPAKGWDDRRKK
jgi:tRNA 2-thiouridine synthesizing protein A